MPGSSSTIKSLRGLSVTGGCCHKCRPGPKRPSHRTRLPVASSMSAGVVKRGDLPNDVLELLGRELGVDRQRQHLARRFLSLREVAGIVLEISETALRMQRHGVVNLRSDAARDQMSP